MPSTTVSFPSRGASLAGTLTTPAGSGPFPAALLLAGSGPLDRDGSHRHLKLNVSGELATELAKVGWASLRYDKRGVGASEGDYMSAGFFDELADAEAARDWLLVHENVSAVVAIGHSGGAVQSVELAGREPAISGAILLATSTKTGEETLRWQARQMGEKVLPAPVRAIMRLFRTDMLKQQDKAIAKLKASTTDVTRMNLAKVNAKWMREFIAYDPLPAIGAASVPMLAITGSKDVQVDPADLAVVARTALDAQVLEVPDVDHILRYEPAPHSNPRHYGKQIKQPLDPRVIEAILTWLRELVRPTLERPIERRAGR